MKDLFKDKWKTIYYLLCAAIVIKAVICILRVGAGYVNWLCSPVLYYDAGIKWYDHLKVEIISTIVVVILCMIGIKVLEKKKLV